MAVDRELFKVEKGIDIPSVAGKRMYPWDELELQDSFVVPPNKKGAAASSLVAYKKRNPKSTKVFVTRTVDEGVRYWRTK